MPVPIPPSMLSSEALVIWMFRIAMNEPIMAARTAIQTLVLARFGSTAALPDEACESGSARAEVDMTLSSQSPARCPRRSDCRAPVLRLRLGLDSRDHGHAGTQLDQGAVIAVQRDPTGKRWHTLVKFPVRS